MDHGLEYAFISHSSPIYYFGTGESKFVDDANSIGTGLIRATNGRPMNKTLRRVDERSINRHDQSAVAEPTKSILSESIDPLALLTIDCAYSDRTDADSFLRETLDEPMLSSPSSVVEEDATNNLSLFIHDGSVSSVVPELESCDFSTKFETSLPREAFARSDAPGTRTGQRRDARRTPSVQLTGWRWRGDYCSGLSSPVADNIHVTLNESANNADESANGDGAFRALAPENLLRMFPEWSLGTPFLLNEQLDDETKGCCGNSHSAQSTFVRWFIAIISLIGLTCVVVGVVFGALTVSGSARLTLCLLMIGVGVVLITVSGLAWRLTSLESNDVLHHSLCFPSRGIQRRQADTNGSIFDRVPYARVFRRRHVGHQYFSDLFQNPDFIWRPPPPSYQTAVRERCSRNVSTVRRNAGNSPATDSPPPTYRSREDNSRPSIIAHSLQGPSRPPSYDAQESSLAIPMSTFSPSISDLVSDSSPIFIASTSLEADLTTQDDRASLVQNEASSERGNIEWRINAADCSIASSNGGPGDRLTIIDCSEPVPVGFEVRRSRMRSNWHQRPYESPANGRLGGHWYV